MKLLLDENLSRRIVPFLSLYYPETTHICLIGLERATDYDIWQYAKKNDFVIVSRDSDYYDLSLINNGPPQVIWLKIPNCSKQIVSDLLINKHKLIYSLLEVEKLKCIELY
jgi:predicted nuclease of predicted toxin-antitoxin system